MRARIGRRFVTSALAVLITLVIGGTAASAETPFVSTTGLHCC